MKINKFFFLIYMISHIYNLYSSQNENIAGKSSNKIVIRYQPRNKEESEYFEKFFKFFTTRDECFMLAMVQNPRYPRATSPTLLSNSILKTIGIDKDIFLPSSTGAYNKLEPDQKILEILLYIGTGQKDLHRLQFPVQEGYKYIIRKKPCTKEEDNQEIEEENSPFCVQKIEYIES